MQFPLLMVQDSSVNLPCTGSCECLDDAGSRDPSKKRESRFCVSEFRQKDVA